MVFGVDNWLLLILILGVEMTEFVWETAIKTTLGFEGGYVNDPNDAGGETKYGISKRAYPNVDIKSLTLEDVKKIYHRDYWERCKCQFLPDALSIAVFDFAVNSGVKRAIIKLQEVLGVSVDGIIGNETIGACNRLPTKKVLDDYTEKRMRFLWSLKGWKYYGNGWGARVKYLRQICEQYL